jgi:hypothetical protein
MSITRKMWAALATLTLCSVSAAATLSVTAATAATPACGMSCLSIFSKELGNPQQPGPVEDILDGAATPGQPVILKQASGSDSSEDTLPRSVGSGLVSDFYAAGMVSADANSHFGSLRAVQIEYAPMGIRSGLCVGLASARPHENEGLTLQPCSVPGVTVFILDFAVSPAMGYFAIINAATTDFDHPFAMSLNPDELASDHQLLQILVRRLQFRADETTVPDSQLWGAHFGPYN